MNETIASMKQALASLTEAATSLTHALNSTEAASPIGNGRPKPKYADIIVAVHGIGEQSRFATVRSVANRLAQSCELRGENDPEPLAPQPLGYFHPAVRGATEVLRLDRFGDDAKYALAGVGFTEVFWADIPQQVDKEGATLEETKAWARTIIARARAAFLRTRPQGATEAERLKEPDFTLAAEVLDEIVETIEVLENLTFLAAKAGVFRLDLHKMLNEYLGDVQIVTEFTQSRRDIVGRFQQVMSRIHDDYPGARLHIVAHSEGTVVSFLGLLHAMSRERLVPSENGQGAQLEPTKELPLWLKQVSGFMTLGSPIDKHLLLWPHLFDSFDLSEAQRVLSSGQIKWRNYYDYGDPVGFNLNTARRWLKDKKNCTVFEFEPKHDIGFARYMLPGKAHNDYWGDGAVFEHFISDVIARRPVPVAGRREPAVDATLLGPVGGSVPRESGATLPLQRKTPGPPATRWWTYVLSPAVPYALSALVLVASVFIFYRSVVNFMQPPLGPVQNFVRYMSVGVPPPETAAGRQLFINALAVTALVAGTTLLSRWPRLTKEKAWWLAGGAAFALGCTFYAMMPRASRDAIGIVFVNRPDSGSWLTLAIPLSLSLVAPWLPFTKWARRTLVVAGFATAAILVWVWNFPGGGVAAAFNRLPLVEPLATLGLLAGAFTLPWCGLKFNREDGTVRFRWWPALVAVALFLAGAAFYLRPEVRVPVDDVFRRWQEPGTYGTVCAALVVALIGMSSLMPPPRKPGAPRRGRRTRWFRKGMRPLVFCGACAIAALIIYQALPGHRPPPLTVSQYNEMLAKFLPAMTLEQAREKARHVMDLITVEPPVWPVVLSGAAFLYLWWLSALIFDLAFVWQRYVRRSVANERLWAWREHPARVVAG